MGLTIHYKLKSTAADGDHARQLVGKMRQLALDLPFEHVSEISHLAGQQCEIDWERRKEIPSDHLRLLLQATAHLPIPWAQKRVKAVDGVATVQSRDVDVPPLEMHCFIVDPGPGCESAEFGLARYPAEVEATYDPQQDARFLDNGFNFSLRKWRRYLERQGQPGSTSPEELVAKQMLKTRLGGWRWRAFCKTQYASDPECGGTPNFLRCHIGVVTLLDRIAKLPTVKVQIDDEGQYGRSRYTDDPAAKKRVYTWHAGKYDPKALAQEVGEWNEMIAASAGALKDLLGPGLAAPIMAFKNFEQLEFKGQNLEHLNEFLTVMKRLAEENMNQP